LLPTRRGIHPTAHVASGAELGEGVVIGPGCVVGPHVRLGENCVLHAHVVVEGDTEVGPRCELFPFACIGVRPQDKKLRSDADRLRREGWVDDEGQWLGRLRIGADNEVRENVTVHGGTPFGSGTTTVGDRNMLLAGSHVGHDSTVGNDCVFTNGAMAAGHSVVHDHAILGAMAGVHQFARIGRFAMIGAGSMVSQDTPPFSLVQGDRARLIAVNMIGLRRSGFEPAQVAMVKRVFRLLFWRSGLLEDRIAQARDFAGGDPLAEEILQFVEASERGVCSPRGRFAPGDEPMDRT
jgi:UDP-N-acetylglucosamine acyltransferase